ncbi:hypothetical protein Q5M49_12980 [Acinetobacter nosocomialis]|uniref:hypothetical protein n=1 Tax=Acinetobacter nosocomialis TaxID=106654 RepID=UPI002703B362|nr:hypothetical protein [Acinetobacter nosocomialis]MDO7194588.1 hypothetical protein [Acinetobacter nosocomialis]
MPKITIQPDGKSSIEEQVRDIFVNIADIISLEVIENDTTLEKKATLRNGGSLHWEIDKTNSKFQLSVKQALTQYQDVEEGYVDMKISSKD